MNINNFLFPIILYIEFYVINCYFEDSPYIIDFKTIKEYENAIKSNKLNFGFMLIYSPTCGHCRNFIPNYIQLSELFHEQLFFFALSSSTNYKKYFKITGYPSIFFYSNKTYNQVKGSRSVQVLSKLITNHVSINCTEISFTKLDIVYLDVYKKTDRNLIIGYLEPNSKYINSFLSITNNLLDKYIDVCYYCIDYNLTNKKNLTERKYKVLPVFQNIQNNEIKAFSRNKGENYFLFNDSEALEDNEYNYENFLFNNVINIYEDINDEEMTSLLDRMKNKNFIFFFYDSNKMKEKFINDINILYNITFNKNDNLYYYILLNKNINLDRFSSYDKDKIYLVSNNFSSRIKIDNLDIIKKNILEYNLQYKNENNSYDININNSNIIDIKKKDYNDINNTLNNSINNISHSFKNISDTINKNTKIINKNYDKIQERKITSNNILKKNENKIKNERYNNDNINEIKKESNKIKYIIIIIGIFSIIVYIVIKKFLCVGFIKVYEDYNIVDLNQSNKLEII